VTRTKIVLILAFLSIGIVLVVCRKDPAERYASQLQKLITGDSIAIEMKRFAEKPHRAGSPQNFIVGEAVKEYLRGVGAHIWTTDYDLELPTTVRSQLEMTFPAQHPIPFSEKAFEKDPYSAAADRETPFFAYVPNGVVESEVIYANFGDRQDYDYLKKQGINVAGKIALVRAQGICRGMKQQIAEEEGIAGLLIYPDVKDQGFLKTPYPDGPGINSNVVQRGSMLKFFLYPGDPWKKNPDRKENTLPTVPALPISPEAAQEIFLSMTGSANLQWVGGMHCPYRSGPGPVRIKFSNQSTRTPGRIRNIFATLGGEDPTEPVLIVSCHYDAWVYGASDPSSGTSVVLEAAKALYALEKKGWKPQRDIVFAFWDAEEYGMIGSTSWVLQHLGKARGNVAAVIYIDSVRGPLFGANIVPGLRGTLDEVLQRFSDPGTGKSVSDIHLEYGMPGFSDDTIPFTNLAGVPVAQLNYGTNFTMYHSIYDNLAWMSKYCDPGYEYTANLARMVALFSILLTKDNRLPFRFSEFGEHYDKQFAKLNLERDFSALQKVANEISANGKEIEKIDFSRLPPDRRKEANRLLLDAILTFTEEPGKSDEPFILRNVALGPSAQNECAGLELSGIQRAMKLSDSKLFEKETDRALAAFTHANELLQKTRVLLQQEK
jgi:N-acetylated-alpha-linked acidic dipeptidase